MGPTSTIRSTRALLYIGAAALAVESAVHLVEWVRAFAQLPVVGPLFLANVIVAALAAVGLLTRASRVSMVAGIAVSAGALVSLGLAHTIGLFGFQTAGLRPATVIAIASEVVAIGALALHARASGQPA